MLLVVLGSFVLCAFALGLTSYFYRHLQTALLDRSELEQELSEARQILKRRAVLAQEVAHEIKNPITAILCSAETLDLLLGKTLDPLHRESLRYIRDYGDQLLRLVSDFLDVSCLESDAVKPTFESVPLLHTVRSVVGLLQSNAQRKGIELSLSADGEALFVRADSKQLKQIVFNLLHNALKFTPVGGSVAVRLTSVDHNSFIELTVADTGPGIPVEIQNRLFDPYFRATRIPRGVDVGVGLGLSLTKALCELCGGTISCSSVEGQGATFTVKLPRAQGVQYLSPPSENGIQNPLEGRRLLLLEQDEGSGIALKRLIEAWGGMVDLVHETTEAVHALEHGEYDTVMLDNDESQAEQLVQHVALQGDDGAPAILLIGDAVEFEGISSVRLLNKPINGERLLSRLVDGE